MRWRRKDVKPRNLASPPPRRSHHTSIVTSYCLPASRSVCLSLCVCLAYFSVSSSPSGAWALSCGGDATTIVLSKRKGKTLESFPIHDESKERESRHKRGRRKSKGRRGGRRKSRGETRRQEEEQREKEKTLLIEPTKFMRLYSLSTRPFRLLTGNSI